MEQAVWLYVGIIAAFIGLGFVASIVVSGRETSYQQTTENTIKKLQQNCDLVCGSDTETMFSADVTLIGGMKLYGSGNAICADYAGRTTCRECGCALFDKEGAPFTLDLSGARGLFESNDYKCFMERVEEGVAVECNG